MTRPMSKILHIQPAEWDLHSAVWSAWPSDGKLWQENLEFARREVEAFYKAIVDLDPATGVPRGELLKILACGEDAVASARACLHGTGAEIIPATFGDIWIRDTAPIFVQAGGQQLAACFKFNGWGGKYLLDGDSGVSSMIASHTGLQVVAHNWILEGGSIDVDGAGTALTTRQCLLNPNRNPNLTEHEIEEHLSWSLGIKKLIWLGDGLVNDHTDGHIDNIARFVAPGVVGCMEPSGLDDPNYDTLTATIASLKGGIDACGRKLDIATIPSPGRVEGADGEIIPASFVNFYIGNTTVVVPVYGTKKDDSAVERIARLFPTRRTVGLLANHVISGGGSFHCITQQQPAV